MCRRTLTQIEEEASARIEAEVTAQEKSCSEDLARAEPAIARAEAALRTLNKPNLTELKSLPAPPPVWAGEGNGEGELWRVMNTAAMKKSNNGLRVRVECIPRSWDNVPIYLFYSSPRAMPSTKRVLRGLNIFRLSVVVC